jgi:hypothetical protein
MKQQLTLAALLAASLALTACAKKENAPAAEAETGASAVVESETISPEQQAAIDAIDQPILDEKNTDVPAEIANAPADEATADESVAAASEPAAQ